MSLSPQNGRYTDTRAPTLAEGWHLERLTRPSRLFGANGLRTGPDGRIYVAQVSGSQVSALDLETGALETISAPGSDIVAPDDVDFDPSGNLYVTEYYDGRVSVRGRDGRTRVLRDDLPGANGITFHQGRLFIDECRVGGRLLELDLDGGSPRVLVENLPLPNAMEVGPDGLLYYPVMGTNDIWRIHPDGGTPERVVGDLGAPDAVKFDSKGFIVSTQGHTGEVLRINPQSGEREVLASLDPGVDNLTFVGERLFVSSFTGQITEILGGGRTKTLLPRGLSWPLDLTVGPDGNVYVADGHHFFVLQPGGELETVATLFSPGFPGNLRGLVAVGDGEFVTSTTTGLVARYRPADNACEVLAEGLDQVYGLDAGADGQVVVAEFGTGRVVSIRAGAVEPLASGLQKPLDVALAPDGGCFVSESGAGRVAHVDAGGVPTTALDGLQHPQGVLVRDGQLFVVDAGKKTLVALDLKTRARQTLASGLPVGTPDGVVLKPLRGIAPFTGPQAPFAGIAAGPDGGLYVSGDAEGSVLALRKRAS
ncbi:MAG: SMP-30/gluconolactonase/LRE family protein [Myxococcales bacterium]|nr:SMP-30/gluconolactonase/LRE family protein [Myxococcales bacterium]